MSDECMFCQIVRGEIYSERIYENDNFFSIFDVHPKTEGHCLIISKKHFETVLDIPSISGSEFLDCVKKTAIKVLNNYCAEGFNLLMNSFEVAGQEVKHFHAHIIPRRKSDGLSVLS